MQSNNNFNAATSIKFIRNSYTDVNLSEELSKYGLDSFQIYSEINQNGTHFFRTYVRYITKNKYIFITPAEYEHLLQLKQDHDLNIKLDKSLWHCGTLINGGEWSLVSFYTNQPKTYFHGVGYIENYKLTNNIFKYVNKPILVNKNILNLYLEMSNDINLAPTTIIDNSITEIIINSNRAVEEIWLDIIWNKNNSIMQLKGGSFEMLTKWDDYRYYKFYQKIGETLNNQNEILRQTNNIIRDMGYGHRRLKHWCK